jgi:beta-carotene 15,15'-dioxygenase
MQPVLLALGLLLIFTQHHLPAIAAQTQFIIFITGIIILGVPHGAADLLVAMQNALLEDKKFVIKNFFVNYLLRLFLFCLLFWIQPFFANVIFLIIAAYHFGETDLHQFKIDTFIGKLFVFSYGLIILSVIILNNFNEALPLLNLLTPKQNYTQLYNNIRNNQYIILSISGLFFLATTFVYFVIHPVQKYNSGNFIPKLVLILLILYNLPMLLGFTFYFVVWHSVLSLQNITAYLQKKGAVPAKKIWKQIVIYSLFAMAGICLVGLGGFMFKSIDTVIFYTFIGLAVLTAPHMQVMHSMYNKIRNKTNRAV